MHHYPLRDEEQIILLEAHEQEKTNTLLGGLIYTDNIYYATYLLFLSSFRQNLILFLLLQW